MWSTEYGELLIDAHVICHIDVVVLGKKKEDPVKLSAP